jgi:hypothetical protein
MKIYPVRTESFREKGRTDMTKLIVSFRNFANTLKKWLVYCNLTKITTRILYQKNIIHFVEKYGSATYTSATRRNAKYHTSDHN